MVQYFFYVETGNKLVFATISNSLHSDCVVCVVSFSFILCILSFAFSNGASAASVHSARHRLPRYKPQHNNFARVFPHKHWSSALEHAFCCCEIADCAARSVHKYATMRNTFAQFFNLFLFVYYSVGMGQSNHGNPRRAFATVSHWCAFACLCAFVKLVARCCAGVSYFYPLTFPAPMRGYLGCLVCKYQNILVFSLLTLLSVVQVSFAALHDMLKGITVGTSGRSQLMIVSEQVRLAFPAYIHYSF